LFLLEQHRKLNPALASDLRIDIVISKTLASLCLTRNINILIAVAKL